MPQDHRPLRLSLTYLVAALLLCSMFGLTVASSLSKSPVIPETATLNVLSSLGILAAPDSTNITRLIFLARFPVMLSGLLLGALMFRWGRRVYGLWPGLVTLALLAFSPTIIAYSQIATGDLVGAALALAALYRWTRYMHHPTRGRAVSAGVLAGLALAVSFLTIPLIVAMLITPIWHRHHIKSGVRTAAITLLSPWLAVILTATALFALARVLPAPLSVLTVQFPSGSEIQGYLIGRFIPGLWAYPALLLLKMTVPEMILVALAAVLLTMRGIQHHEWDFVIPAVAHMLFVTPLLLPRIEIRYLLFVIPLLFLFASRAAAPTLPRFSWRRMTAAGVIAAAQIPICLGAFPYFLSYFNFAVGGSENGYQLAAGSNLDWGQSLPGLAAWMRQNNFDHVNLSYFGDADPAWYGIDATWLPSWPHLSEVDFVPLDPQPGVYAISASNLVGIPESTIFPRETYAWFLNHPPTAVIGHSLFIYNIPPDPDGTGGWGAICASPDPILLDQSLRQLAGMPELPAFYFDCRQSLAIPEGAGWVVLPADVTPVVDLGPADFSALDYAIWKIGQPPAEPASAIAQPQAPLPLPIADHLELLGYQVSAPTVRQGDTLVVTGWWRIRTPPPPPVSISVRLVTIDPSGIQQDILSGDALGLPAELWQPGLTLIQKNALTITDSIPPGDYWLAVGLFDVTTGRHFPVSETEDQTIDRIILQPVTITARSQ